MSLKPGEPLTHEDVVFAERLGGSAIAAAAVIFLSAVLA